MTSSFASYGHAILLYKNAKNSSQGQRSRSIASSIEFIATHIHTKLHRSLFSSFV